MSSTNGVPISEGQSESEALTLPEIRKRYKDRWVAIVVTRRDRNLQPTNGRVVAEDIDRFMLRQKLGKYPDICILFAGDPVYPPMRW